MTIGDIGRILRTGKTGEEGKMWSEEDSVDDLLPSNQT